MTYAIVHYVMNRMTVSSLGWCSKTEILHQLAVCDKYSSLTRTRDTAKMPKHNNESFKNVPISDRPQYLIEACVSE